jgi:WD40 repeat protein
VKAGTENARLEGHSRGVRTLCVLPDGRLASGGTYTIRLWNVKAGVETTRLEGHSRGVNAMCVLPDGRLASGSQDNTIRLWDVKAGTESARLEVDAPVFCLVTISDRRLIAGDGMGRLHWLEIVT